MTIGQPNRVFQHLRRAALLGNAGDPSDGQLLESFLVRRDEIAFEALVRRHGPMVLGVCRRVTGNVHDAEDAFQATFLVLVRKARSVVPREMVGNWLHGVACRTALRARSAAAQRRVKERQVPPRCRQDADDARWHDWQPLLDQELSRLPDKYRVPVLLCDLEGKSRKEVARLLGWPEGTLSCRLARARALLAKRLARHELPLSAGAVATLLTQAGASAAVPPALVTGTIRVGMLVAAGKAAAAGTVPAGVAALAEGVLKAMLLTRLKLAAALLLAVAVLGAGLTGFATSGQNDAEPGSRSAQASPAKDPGKGSAAADRVHQVGRQQDARDNRDVWTLRFRFKDPRRLDVNIPGKGKRTIWYIWYQVSNPTNDKLTFYPDFELLLPGQTATYHDEVLPSAEEAVRRTESLSALDGLKNSITIAASPLSAPEPKGTLKWVTGIAIWDDVPADAARFTIWVSGLSNKWVLTEPGVQAKDGKVVIGRKTLQLDFQRAGKEMRFVPPVQWLYRLSALQPVESPADKAPPKKSEKPARDADLIQGTWSVVGLEQVNHEPTADEKRAYRARALKITITADKIIMMDKSEGRYRLDPTTKPKRMRLTISDATKTAHAHAIYQLEGDDLKICMGRADETEPPPDFDLKRAPAGTFPTLWVLKRDAAAASKPAAQKPAKEKVAPGADLLRAQRERLLIELQKTQAQRERLLIEQRMAQVVQTTIGEARRTQRDAAAKALDLLRGTLLRVWDDPNLSERVREDLLSQLLAARRELNQNK